jgi:hypothetical protein
MWEKLKIRERERRLGMVFVAVLAAVCGGSLLALGFPLAGPVVGGIVLVGSWLAAARRIVALREGNYGPAPVGPLSPDEKAKARAKLVGVRRLGAGMR